MAIGRSFDEAARSLVDRCRYAASIPHPSGEGEAGGTDQPVSGVWTTPPAFDACTDDTYEPAIPSLAEGRLVLAKMSSIAMCQPAWYNGTMVH